MARRTKAEAEQTRMMLIDAAEKVFYDHGVSRTSLQKVAEAAGVTRGAFYWHFRNKAQLLQAMLDRVVSPEEAVLDYLVLHETDQPLDGLLKCSLGFLEKIKTDKRLRRVMTIIKHRCEYNEELADFFEKTRGLDRQILKKITVLFERAQKMGDMKPMWTPASAALTVDTFFTGTMFQELAVEKSSFSYQDFADCFIALFQSIAVKDIKLD